MELIDPLVPWEPLVTRSIVHLIEEVGANNERAAEKLGYVAKHEWQKSVLVQIEEMLQRGEGAMPLAKPV
ncbi:hypothetical protein BOW53_15680 [Solemya pervernicosa gill symbiont]|uniref:Uncharacterized protein n=1 Tax=Solemya pervernicosa gill symbiont TaxID=642797 RepID=A0A1T2KZW7_9GAMM|nr:hypothetical protein BOW53_15680 [Solemya pervernicosa gill symbiont]